MSENEIRIQMPDGIADAVLYLPDSDARRPGVIHLTDIGGIRPAHRDMARRLAGEGYAVLMPNVFYRTSRPPVMESKPASGSEQFRKRLEELTAPLTPEAIDRDARAYIDFLAGQGSVSEGGMGVVGYCYTGAVAMRLAAVRPDKIMAAASFHGGRLFTGEPTSPHLLLPRIKARLYFAHAFEDRSMPADAIEKFDRALAAWGGEYKSEVYQGAHHSWTSPDSPVYNQPQAERAFQELKKLLSETLHPALVS